MRRVGIAPKSKEFSNEYQLHNINDWLFTVGERLNVYTGDADPTAAEIPENQYIVFYNSNANEVRIWTNIAGVALKSAAFT